MTLQVARRLAAFLWALAMAQAASASPPRYTMTILECPAGQSSAPAALNDDGLVVGRIDAPPHHTRPAVWRNGELQDLPESGSTTAGEALAVNDRGDWIGFIGDPSSQPDPFYWRSGARLELLTGEHAVARGLDDGERVVGERLIPEDRKLYVDMVPRAFLWENGHLHDIAADVPDEGSVAAAVNNRGIVVGWSNCGCRKTPGDRAFVWENGTVTYTGTFGGSESRAFAVNDRGVVVGEAEILQIVDGQPTKLMRAFRWESGNLKQLGTLGGPTSTARGINERDEIVGWSANAQGETRAFVWRDGTMVDLNEHVDDALGWIIRRAFDINGQGDIAGQAERNGETRAVLLKAKR